MTSTDRTDHGPVFREENVREEEINEAIGEQSPEGRPSGPEPRMGGWSMVVIAMMLVFVVIGLIIAVAVHRLFGLTIIAIGIALVVFNPVLWASFARALDREKVEGRR